jgi:hypothetical protein
MRGLSLSQDREVSQDRRSTLAARRQGRDRARCRPGRTAGPIGRWIPIPIRGRRAIQGLYLSYRSRPFRTDQCEVCLRSKIERYPKTGEAPLLRGGVEGIALDVDVAGLPDLSVDGCRYLFVGIERSSGMVFAVPIETKADAMKAVKEAVAKLERQLGERVRVIRTDAGTEFGGGEGVE